MPRHTFVIDASELTRTASDSRHPLIWGFMGMIAIELTVFTCLAVSYFYLKMSSDAWPPHPLPYPKLLLPTINTVLLIASSFVMHWADGKIRAGEERKLAIGLTLGVLMATAFIVLKYVEYFIQKDYRWNDHAYGSIVWTIVGFHSAHVISVALKTVIVAALAWRSYFSQEWRLAITANGFYWHFVVAVWIPLYVILYWSPRFL